MADERTAQTVDVDALSDEDAGKLIRGEELPGKEPEPKPEEQAKPAAEDDEDNDDVTVTVPHGKFHRANERRKAAEQRAEAAERSSQLAMQRLSQLLEASKPPPVQQEEPPEPPDWTVDPIGRMQHEAARIAELESKLGQTEQAAQQRTAEQAVLEASVMDINQYVQEKPEAGKALTYLAQLGAQHLRSQGMTDPAQISQSLNKWQVQLAYQARQMGIRPARLLHTMAEERGWKPEAAATDPPAPTPERDPATGRFKAADDIDKLQATKEKAKSLGGSGAPVNTGELSPQDIVDMSPEEFAAFKAKWDKALGEGGAMRRAFGQ